METRRRLSPVVRLAPAKLNLTLAVVGRREDGYHTLHSVFVPLTLADRLSLAPVGGHRDTLHVTGLDAGPPADLRFISVSADYYLAPYFHGLALAYYLEPDYLAVLLDDAGSGGLDHDMSTRFASQLGQRSVE